MALAMEAQPVRAEQPDGRAKHIVFFHVETNVPGHLCGSFELLEFEAVVLDAVRGLGELRSFHTLIRPKDISCIDRRTTECNTITPATVADAPAFADVAHDIYQLLHGHIWAGHNMSGFAIPRVKEAFFKTGRLAPQPSGFVDTCRLLKRFQKRAGNVKLATLASYCGYGKQEHRSKVRMTIHVLRNCATMLFLESNYPEIFMAQVDVATSTSVLKQSPSFFTSSSQKRFLGNGDEEQVEVVPQIRSINRVRDQSSASRTSGQARRRVRSKMDKDSNPLRRTNLLSAFEAVDDMGKEEQPHSSCSRVLMEDEQFVSSKLSGVSRVLEVDHIQEDVRTAGYECARENASAAKMMDLKSKEEVKILMRFLEADEAVQLRDELLCMVDKSVREQDSLQVSNNSTGDMEAAGAIRSPKFVEEQDLLQVGNDSTRDMEAAAAAAGAIISPTTAAQLSTSGPRMEFKGVPFLLASHVILPSIEVRPSCNALYYNGFPLNVLEFKVRVRFTIHPAYAFDEKGKPRFSILIEPSQAACNIMRKCEDLAKRMTSSGDREAEWLPALRKESGCWAGRMSIATKWTGSFWTYTTEFYRSTSNGLEKISLDLVNASTFISVLPHGSIIDIGYGFYIFNVNNRIRGVRFLAKHITLC